MTIIFLNLVVERLKHKPMPFKLMSILSMIFDASVPWNVKNRNRGWASSIWVSKFGSEDQVFARPNTKTNNSDSEFNDYKPEFGWMVNLINKFCELKGIEALKDALKLNENSIDAHHYTAVLQPFANCAQFLNPSKIQDLLVDVVENSVEYIHHLEDEDLKHKVMFYFLFSLLIFIL